MTIRMVLLVAAQVVIVVLVAGYGAVGYLTSGRHTGFESKPLPLTAEEIELGVRLKRHVETLAVGERNLAHYEHLERAAAYIEFILRNYGYTVSHQDYTVDGKVVRNIEAVIETPSGVASPDVIVIGAHYDSAAGTPGADSNASGTAAVLELSLHLAYIRGSSPKRVRFVFFANKEPPYFQTPDMGSVRYVKALAARKERVTAMYAFDSVGYYTDEPGTQRQPPLLGLLLPDRGNFVAFVGGLKSRQLARDTQKMFKTYTPLPSGFAVGPSFIPGTDWSDNWAFAQQGFPAVLVTDTGAFRNPHYHKSTDTPDKIDYAKLTRVVKGMEVVMRLTLR